MASVIITGSSGFLGQRIAATLADSFTVIGFDIATPEQGAAARTIATDLTSDQSVEQAFRDAVREDPEIASIIHLAAYYDLSGEESPHYERITIEGTRRLLEKARRYEPQQIVFASTLLVHAPTERAQPITEDSPIDPAWAYPASKIAAEQVVQARRDGVRAVTIRPAGVYDEDCRAAFLAQQIVRIYERQIESRFYSGDASVGQPFLHVADLADAVARIVERRARLPQDAVYLLAEPFAPSYGLLQDRIGCELYGDDWDTLEIPKPLAKAGAWVQEEVLRQDPFIKPWMVDISDDHYEVDPQAARRDLGWFPRHNILSTLPEMIARLKADPPRWYAINKLDPARVAAADPVIARAAEDVTAPMTAQEAKRVDEEIERGRDQERWAHLVNIALGFWLALSPFSYGLFDPVAAPRPPALGFEIADASTRNAWLGVSEIVSGILVAGLSARALGPQRWWGQWLIAGIGVWIMLAPLVFWTTNPAAYNMDSLVGLLVILFSVMVQPTPGIAREALASNADVPLGWTYSPSTLVQRVPIVALAFVGLFVSRYLTSYQLGHNDGIFDPFFLGGDGLNGSEAVVTSSISHAFPIPDAGLGALAYALDILAGAAGSRARWREMPWLVILFGLLIVPLGAVSIGFIIMQPTIIGALCTLCLVQAAITVILIPYSIDEVLASVQYMAQSHRAGRHWWITLWRGGPPLQEKYDPTPDLNQKFVPIMREFLNGGVQLPLSLAGTIVLGVVLLCTPLFLGAAGPLYYSDHIVGCLVITFAVTALAEIARPLRFLLVPLGAWVVASPFIVGDDVGVWAIAVRVIIGAAIALLALPRGERSKERYGEWERWIF